MIRSTYALVLLVCGGLALSACKKKDDADATAASGSASASAAPPVAASATASAAPADTASAAPSGSSSAAPPDTSTPVANAVPQRPIDDCCIALASAASSRHRNTRKKKEASKAAEICPGIAVLVRQGRATRSQALTQIRSAMAGDPSPAACQ
jgi:hypothetical protein